MRRALLALAFLFAVGGCSSGPRSNSGYAARLPPEVRASYDVFARRCSKCHSLARPLDSGIDDDAYWAMYVDRMRRQPASGISIADRAPILAFLHYYALDQRARKATRSNATDASADGGAQ
jgi:hypothetical protein